MKRAGLAVLQALCGAAWVFALLTVLVLAFERGPWLRDLVRQRLANELGAIGPALDIDSLRVHWLASSVELRGVSLERMGGGLFLDRVQVDFDLSPRSRQRLRSVLVEGGRLEVYPSLFDDLQEIGRSRSGEGEEGPGEPAAPELPAIEVRGLRVDVSTPRYGNLPVGVVHLLYELGRAGPSLSGQVVPSFTPRGTDVPIYFRGTASDEWLEVRTDAPNVPVSLERLAGEPFLDLLPFRDPSGELTMSANLRIKRDGSQPPRLRTRVALAGAAFQPAAPVPRVEQLDLELSTEFAPEPGQGLNAVRAWSSVATLQGRWLGTPIEGWIRAGRDTAPGSSLEGWVHLPELPVGEENLTALVRAMGESKASEVSRIYWALFQPSGHADAALALRCPFPPTLPAEWEWLAELSFGGNVDAAWHGPVYPRSGQREGIPVPVSGIEGRLVFGRDPAQRQPERLGLIDLEGAHASGVVRSSGTVSHPLVPGDEADVEIEVHVPSIDVDGPLREVGLPGMEVTRFVLEDFQPRGGTVEGLIQLQSGPRTGGLDASLDLDLKGTTMAWKDLPVPVRDADASVRVRWTERPVGRLREDGKRERPVGVAFHAEGHLAAGPAQRVAVDVTWRGDAPLEPEPRVGWPPASLTVEVDLEHMLLKGDDWDTLVAALPEARTRAEGFRPKGWADAHFYRTQPVQGAPARWETEVTPGEVAILPAQFPMDTRNVRGRLLVRGEDPARPAGVAGDAGRQAQVGSVGTNIDLTGTWPHPSLEVEVAASVRVPPGADGRAELFAAGIDPDNRSLLGSLQDALRVESERRGEGRGELDLSALAARGSLDFGGEVAVVPESAEPSPMRFRVFLRECDLEADEFRLTRMNGVLTHEDGILRSDRIDAILGSTPVRLRSAELADARELPRLESSRRLLDRMGLVPETGGYLLTSTISALAPVPLDRTHLGLLFAEDALERVLADSKLRGQVEFTDLDLALTGDGLGRGKVGLHGPVAVSDLFLVLGLPIQVFTGELLVQSLVFEAGRVRGWVDLSGVAGSIADRAIRDSNMMLTYVDGRLSVDHLQAFFDFGGEDDGQLTSLGGVDRGGTALALDVVDPYRFALALQLDGVRLNGLLEGLFDAGIAEPGSIDATLRLAGTPDNLNGIRGSGALFLSRARLWSIPVARELFSTLGLDDTATFQTMRSRFEVRDGVISLNDMQAKSPLAKLVGDGTVDLDGSVRADMQVRYSLVDKLGPINRILYWIQNNLLRVAIRGDLARPFVFLRNSVFELFTGFEESPRALPLPSLRPLPLRF